VEVAVEVINLTIIRRLRIARNPLFLFGSATGDSSRVRVEGYNLPETFHDGPCRAGKYDQGKPDL
jgi:hypothetical protein